MGVFALSELRSVGLAKLNIIGLSYGGWDTKWTMIRQQFSLCGSSIHRNVKTGEIFRACYLRDVGLRLSLVFVGVNLSSVWGKSLDRKRIVSFLGLFGLHLDLQVVVLFS